MKLFQRTVLILVLALTAPLSVYANGNEVKEKFADMASKLEAKCSSQFATRRELLSSSGKELKEEEVIYLEMQERAQCTCLPNKIRTVSDPETIKALLSTDQNVSMSVVRMWQEECNIRELRDAMPKLCAIDARKKPDPEKALKECSCMTTAVNALTDQQLADESKEAYKHFQARVKDRTLPKRKSIMDSLSESCKAEAALSN